MMKTIFTRSAIFCISALFISLSVFARTTTTNESAAVKAVPTIQKDTIKHHEIISRQLVLVRK